MGKQRRRPGKGAATTAFKPSVKELEEFPFKFGGNGDAAAFAITKRKIESYVQRNYPKAANLVSKAVRDL